MVFPVIYILLPYTALIQDDYTRYFFFLLLMFIKGCVVIIGFPCTTIMLTNSAASLRILGTLNGFATTFSGMGRAVGPAMTGSVFTLGVQKGYMIFPWWLLAFVALIGAVPLWFMVEGPGPTPAQDTDDDDDDDGEEDDTLPGSNDDDQAVLEYDEIERRFITSGHGDRAPRVSGDLIVLDPEPEDPDDSDSLTGTAKQAAEVRLRPVSANSSSSR